MKIKLILLLLSAHISIAQTLPNGFETVAYEGFDYSNGTSLLGLNGGSGFSAAWTGSYQDKYMQAHGTGYTYSGLNTTGGRASYSSTCYGICNNIASSDRTIQMQSEGVVYVQFLANLGPQAGGGTPQIRFRNTETNLWALLAGALTDNEYKWGIWDTANTYMTNISSNTERFVIIRFDYVNNNTKMWIDQDVTTFDYSNPTNPDATSPMANSFNRVDLYFRSPGPHGIDEIHVFKESSETFTNSSGDGQWDTASNWASGSVPSSSTNVTISSGQTITSGSNGFNSIRLDGAQNNYLQINNSSGTFQETGDFTFEMWVKINAWDPNGSYGYKASFLGYSQHNFWLSINGSGKPQFRMGCGDLTFNYIATQNNWEGNWKHMAIVRDDNTLKFFVDGVLEATSSCSGGTFMNSNTIKIGKNNGWPADLDAWISKIRYVKGSALYSSDFTPPTSLSNVSGTHLLLNVDSQTNAFVDSSDNNHTVSIHGSSDPYFVSSNGPSGSGNSTTAAANTITVDSGGSLTIAANSDLTLSGDFTNNGTVTLNSEADEFASIIVGGSSSGDIVYNRYVNTEGTDEWDLIGSPVDGLSISSFVTTNSSPLATSGSIYAIGVYDNSDDSWTNYTSSTVAAAGNFDVGKGYQMATSSGTTMAFTGTIATTDQTQSIINNTANGGRRWNLVANPYPSYLNANTNAHTTNNLLSVNSGVIDGTYLALYGYDADGSGYTIYNNTSGATYIAPGQAFFVAAASSSAADLSFTEAMQTTTGGDDFIAGRLANTSSEFDLKLYEEQNLVADTKFYFDNNLSPGLDPGYDAGAYNQSSALSSRLAKDDQGVNMGINAMGIDSFEQTTIPLVVNSAAGVTFRISLGDVTIPEGVGVYLEDTQLATFTDLRAEDFTLNPQSDLSGMGRFYLRLGNTSLGGSDLEESYISIYKPMDKEYITIEGLANIQKTNIRFYNMLGQEILSKTLQTNLSTQNISTAGLTTGIYIVKLEADNSLVTKKLMIN